MTKTTSLAEVIVKAATFEIAPWAFSHGLTGPDVPIESDSSQAFVSVTAIGLGKVPVTSLPFWSCAIMKIGIAPPCVPTGDAPPLVT